MNHRDRVICEKIVTYCEEIDGTHKMFEDNEELFHSDQTGFVYRNAISMPIMQIGELAKSLSDEFVEKCQVLPWKEIKGMRDHFAHGYGKMNRTKIWKTSHDDISLLYSTLSEILNNEKD